MLNRDYILRLIQMFYEALEKFLEKVPELEPDDIKQQFDTFYLSYFRKESQFFYEGNIDDIMNYFSSEVPADERVARMEMLANLLYRDGLTQSSQEIKDNLLTKSLALLNRVENESDTYSLVRKSRIVEIQSYLS